MFISSKNQQTLFSRFEWIILGVLILLLLGSLIYWRTLTVYFAPFPLLPISKPLPSWALSLYSFRWWVIGGTTVIFVALAILELRNSFISAFVCKLFSFHDSGFFTLTLLTLIGRSYLFLPGRLALGDNANVVNNSWAMRYWIETGNPGIYWSNYVLMGSPYSQFHLSLYYYIAGLIDLIVRDPAFSNKILLMFAHIAMTYSMFIFVKYLTRSLWAGLLSAMIWSSSFFHYHQFVGLGTIVTSLLLAIIPLGFYWFEKSLGEGLTTRHRAWLALAIGVQIWIHQLYGALSTGFLLLYILFRVISSYRLGTIRQKLKEIIISVVWVGVGISIGLYKILPVLLEQRLVKIGDLFSKRFVLATISFAQILNFNDSFLTSDWWGGYIGPAIISLSVIGLLLILVNRYWRGSGILILFCVTGFLSFAPYYAPTIFDAIFKNIPLGEFIYSIKTPGRYLFFFEFVCTVMCGIALKQSLVILGRRFKNPRIMTTFGSIASRASLILGIPIMMYMIYLSLIVNSLYPEQWTGQEPGHHEVFEWISQHGDGVSRVMDVPSEVSTWNAYEVAMYSGQPSFFNHQEEQPPSALLPITFLQWFERDMKAHTIQPTTWELAYLLDIRYIFDRQSQRLADLLPVYETDLYKIWNSPAHSPIVIAERVTATEKKLPLETAIANITIDVQRRSINAIPAEESIAKNNSFIATELPRLDILLYEIKPQSMKLVYSSNTDAYSQLSYSYYPYINIFLDGQKTEFFSTSLNLIGLRIPAGIHQIEIIPYLSEVRIFSLLIGMIAIVSSLSVIRFGQE